MFEVANELEHDPKKYSWKDTLEKTQEHYHHTRDYWTPAGKAATVSVSKKEFQNFINTTNQCINNLKLKDTTPASGNNNNNSNNNNNKETVCWDCGEPGVKKGHDGCPNPGSGLHTPEKYKKKNGGANNNNGGNNNGSNEENWPDNDEKMEDGQKFVLCHKCFNQNKKGYGVWRRSTNPKAHKTTQHKVKNESSGKANTATTNATDILQQISDKNPSPRT